MGKRYSSKHHKNRENAKKEIIVTFLKFLRIFTV